MHTGLAPKCQQLLVGEAISVDRKMCYLNTFAAAEGIIFGKDSHSCHINAITAHSSECR